MNPDDRPWPIRRRETELDLLRQASRDAERPVRLLGFHGEPMESALLMVLTPYLAYRQPIGPTIEALLAVSRRPARDDEIAIRRNPVVAVELPPQFPDEAPVWHMLTPDVANPAVLGNQICFSQGWRGDFTVLAVAEGQLISLLRCQPGSWDARRPLNPAIADWIAVQRSIPLPLDGSPTHPSAKERIRRIR